MHVMRVGAILVTGSSGLIGSSLCRYLHEAGEKVIECDIRTKDEWDICRPDARQALWPKLLRGVRGVIHLAPVSRVVIGQKDPERCWRTNVLALKELTKALENLTDPPWLILASSREVYGQPAFIPALDDGPIAPLNVYAASKATGELIAKHYHDKTKSPIGIVRFSSVYGSAADHRDRVIPAFAHAAAFGHDIKVHGAETTIDITHLSDVVPAMLKLIHKLDDGIAPDKPLLLASGLGTRLIDLAEMALAISAWPLKISITEGRNYDVAKFIGQATYARQFLDWDPQSRLDDGLRNLMQDILDLSK